MRKVALVTLAVIVLAAPLLWAFPTTTILDTFNRATEDPLSDGGKWSGNNPLIFGHSHLFTNGTTVVGASSGNNTGYRQDQTYGPDVEVFVDISVVSGTNIVGVYARVTNPNSSGATDGYDFSLAVSGGTDTIRIGRIDNDVRTILLGCLQEVSSGDSIGLSIVGNTLTGYYKASGGSWVEAGGSCQTTDSTYTGAGNIGLQVNNTSHRADNFGGGTIVAGAPSSLTVRRRNQ